MFVMRREGVTDWDSRSMPDAPVPPMQPGDRWFSASGSFEMDDDGYLVVLELDRPLGRYVTEGKDDVPK